MSTQGVYTFKFNLSIGFAVASHEAIMTVEGMGWEPEEWDAMSEEQRNFQLEENLKEWASSYVEASWEAA